MIKKLLLVGVIGVAAFAALKGTKFGGLAREEIKSAQSWLDDQIPVEKEIQRLRKEVQALDKDRGKAADLLAREIVEVRYLRENTDELRVSLGNEEDRLTAKAKEIKEANQKVKYGGYVVSIDEAKDLLKADVARFQNKKVSLQAQEKSLALRERNKDYLEKQLDVLKRQKLALTTEVETLEAEWKALQLQQMESKYQSDDTRLAKVKDGIRDLRMKMEVEREKLKLAPRVAEEGAPATTGSSAGQSVDEIMAPVTGKKDDKNVTKK